MGCQTSVQTSGSDQAPASHFRARDPFVLVIFGASGDLARRKLIPALHQLAIAGFLPDKFAVVGFSRSPMSDDAYRDAMREALGDGASGDHADRVLKALHYVAGNNDDADSFTRLKSRIEELEGELGLPGNRLCYLSVGPEFFAPIVTHLAASGIVQNADDARGPKQEKTWARVVVEKPFGRDLQSARALNEHFAHHLHESQIYRIDHYLGKETVQNLLGFRFGNAIFEPLFNRNYVQSVQITAAETLGMEGKRGGYYDTAGALRDMVQNHLMQLLTMTAMEPPAALDADSLRSEKVKVLQALEPMTLEQVRDFTVRGQYGPGIENGKPTKAYRAEQLVSPDSSTETFVALRLMVDNWRWAGVPFYLRTGKRLADRCSEIVITFKEPPLPMFRELAPAGQPRLRGMANTLTMRIQPDEGISLTFAAKEPGMEVKLDEVRMDFSYKAFERRSPEAYERLLLDVLRGDAALFIRGDEVDHAWRFIQSIQNGWAELPVPSFPNYAPFSEGPDEVERLFRGTSDCFRPLGEGRSAAPAQKERP